ncbi:HupE/UreJ family protein [Methylobacterium sp. C25]|uniref:HupE/UreJ family protein n=1 Tax=Methylobacterium sp. C25 TaxID=2721622 RepID=UPI001F24B723|nr:HupE/UreJ family protein [Methylobacterium sp. C25]MCE4222178.1 HupE/UreJ family protein [Methylobacterium sp. C25]
MIRRLMSVAVAGSLLAGMSTGALAHPGHDDGHGLAAGVLHPLLGADHVLAMVAVGLIGALRGGRAVWALPATFLGMMVAGAGFGLLGVPLPYAEGAILASVVLFGLLAISSRRLPTVLLAGLIGAFAVFHGYAHVVEMPENSSAVLFGLGFLAATAFLHAVGVAIGVFTSRTILGAKRTAASSHRPLETLTPASDQN